VIYDVISIYRHCVSTRWQLSVNLVWNLWKKCSWYIETTEGKSKTHFMCFFLFTVFLLIMAYSKLFAFCMWDMLLGQ